MSEAMTVPPLQETETRRTPTVYFIDDSATMREVIKIAFRRESINVITCADAASALAQFEQNKPDVVITDVIMPDQDGYAVCSQIKQHPDYGNTPVVLMSGVVNKSVADKAVAVKADELIRKPFQPQELIGRVKSLLEPKRDPQSPAADRASASAALNSLFAPPAPRPVAPPLPVEQRPTESAWPRALAEAFSVPRPPESTAQPALQTLAQHPAVPGRQAPSMAELQKLRAEIARLELLVKKLQTEIQIEKQYSQALELQIQALTRVEG
jgi:twitching motility two-component system response regulator PilH